MIALLRRDLALTRRDGTNTWVGLLFLVAVVALLTFGIGTEVAVLRRVGPGVLWAGTLLAGLLGMDGLLRPDRDDGTLDLLATNDTAWEAVAAAKALTHWLTVVAPLVLASPFLALLFGLTVHEAGATALTLLLGTPTLSLAGTLAAAIGLLADRGGLLTAVIAIPFAVPALIFGASAAATIGEPGFLTPLLLLCATTLFAAVITPFAAGAALRNAARD